MVIKEASTNYKKKIFSFIIIIISLSFGPNLLFAQPIPAKIIPEFTFYTLKDQPFTNKELKKEGKIFFLFFDATCSHCQYETQLISSHYQDFKNTAFYLVSMDKKQQIQNFINIYGKQLKDKKNVTVLEDKNRQFIQKFMPSQFPALYIYNANHKLLKYWDTLAPIDQILNVIYQH
jgi:peroxiredoxin